MKQEHELLYKLAIEPTPYAVEFRYNLTDEDVPEITEYLEKGKTFSKWVKTQFLK